MSNIPSYHKQSLRNSFPSFTHKLLLLLVICATTVSALSTSAITTQDGITPDEVPSFYRLDGTNGVKVLLDNRQGSNLNYYISMWIRSSKEQGVLGTTVETVFDLQQSFSCGFTATKLFQCNSLSGSIAIDASTLQTQMWVHVAISGSSTGTTYLRLDYASASYKSQSAAYLQLKQTTTPWYASLGINAGLTTGFVGDIREFFITEQYVAFNYVPMIQNQLMTWDPYVIGYYRLLNKNLNEEFRTNSAVLIQKNANNPAKALRDNGPNDICYPFVDQVLLPQISTGVQDGATYSYSLDQRFQKDFTTYKYTFSIWMKTLNGIQTTSSQTQGASSYYFFKLNEVFSLYFNDPTSITIYFDALKNYYATWSNPIFFPLGQWANLQFWVDRVNGYEAKVYDLQKRLLVTVKSNVYLPEQRPSGGFQIGNNFKGYMKSIMLWQTKQTLPIETGNGFDMINNGNLLMYYKFDNPSFLTTGQLPALNYVTVGGFGQTLVFGSSFNFNYQEWTDSTSYTSPSTIGTVFSATTNYDGVACIDKYLQPRTGTASNSYMRFQTQNFPSEITTATVEFWFKRKAPIANPNYLFTFYSTSFGLEYLSIFQDSDKNLTCAPFGSINKGVQIKMIGYDANSTTWTHISCRYIKQIEVTAHFESAYNTSYAFTKSLVNVNTIIPKGNYNIMIGNAYNKTMGSTNTFFKELRFWTSARTNEQISTYAYQQLDVSVNPSLIMYFRFGTGTDVINNYPGLYQASPAEKQGLVLEAESSLSVCPLTTFFNINTKKCHMNPFTNQTLSILSQMIDNKLTWTLTMAYSDAVTTEAYSDLSYAWSTSHMPLQESFISQHLNDETLVFTPDVIVPDFSYPITLTVSNAKKTFSSQATLPLTVQKCLYLVDTNTQTPVVVKELKTTQAASDISFTFSVKQVPGCDTPSYYQYLNSKVSWRILPSNLNLNNIVTIYNADSKTFTLTIPQSEQQKIPSDIPITFVGTVFWDDNQTKATSSIFLNIVYKVTFVSELQAIVGPLSQNVFLDGSMVLDASNSYQTGIIDQAISKAGITFAWTCPPVFQDACANQVSSPQLTISKSDFTTSGAQFSTAYTFTVTAYRQGSSATATASATWIDAYIPQFSLSARGGKLFATKDSYIDILTSNYEAGSSDLSVQYSITPAPLDASLVSLVESNTVLKILTGGLSQNTSFTITVDIKYKTFDESKTTKKLEISTGVAPSGGTITTDPTSGVFLQTTFTIGIANWVSPAKYAPIKYQVYGQSTALNSLVDLSKQYYTQDQKYISTLPQLDGIQVIITDSYGEITKVSAPLSVTMETENDYTQIIKNIDSQNIPNVQKITSYQYVVLELNNKPDIPKTYDNRQSILANIQTSLQNIATSTDAAAVIQSTMPILPLMSGSTEYLNDTIATQIIAVVQQMQQATTAFNTLLVDQQFRTDYATTLSNLFAYTNTKINTATSRRLLADTVITVNSTSRSELQALIKSLIKAKDDLMDQVCGTMKEFEMQEKIATDQFNIIIEKIEVSTSTTTRSYYDSISNTIITVPLQDILTRSKQDPSIQNQCLQTTLYRFNTLNGYVFPNQTQTSNVLVQFTTLSNTGVHFVETQNLNGLQSSFQLTFPYDFKVNNATFKPNQTVCMLMSTELASYTDASWTTGSCSTNYLKDRNQISCQCSSVGPNFYGLFTDITRYSGPNKTVEEPEDFKIKIAYGQSALSVIIILLAMMIGFPIIAIILDKRDYKYIKEDKQAVVSEELLLKIANYKRQPLEQVVYLKRIISDYQHMPSTDFAPVFKLFMKHLHPLFNIFGSFSVRFKRLLRQSIVVFQASVIAILITIIFSAYHKSHEEDTIKEGMTGTDARNAIIAGFILMVLTLPPPQILVSCLYTRLVLEKDLNTDVKTETDKIEDGVDDINLSETQNALKSKLPRNMRVVPENYANEPVMYYDRCMGCKVILLSFSILLCIIAVIVFGVTSGNITKSLTSAMILSWFLAVPGGLLVLNTLRIILITLLAPNMARLEMEGHSSSGISTLLVPREAVEMLKDMLFIKAESNLSVGQKRVYNKTLQQTYNSGASPDHSQVKKRTSPAKRDQVYLENSADIEVQLPPKHAK